MLERYLSNSTRAPCRTSGAASGWSRRSCGISKRRQRFRQARHVLGHVDQRDRQIARRMQDRKPERADQHDVAGGDLAALPERDRPGQQADGQHHRDHGVQDAAASRDRAGCGCAPHLVIDRRVEAPMLAADAGRTPAPAACCRSTSIISPSTAAALLANSWCSGLPGRGQPEHGEDHDAADDRQHGRHRQADGRSRTRSPPTVATHGGSTFQMNMFSTV